MGSHMGTESVLHTVFNLKKAVLRYSFSERKTQRKKDKGRKRKKTYTITNGYVFLGTL